MDIKKIVIIAAVVLLALIGFNYYSSAQSAKSVAARTAETEGLRASLPQPVAQQPDVVKVPNANQLESTAVEPGPVASDDEIFGATATEKVKPEKKMDGSICDSVIKLAENMMRNRQNGVPIATSLEFANNIADGTTVNDAASKITKQIVIDAYSQPSFSTGTYKEDAIREFGAKQYLACMRAFD